jgi:polyhydroxyalkanoate synthesis repressor PhaR
MGRTLAARRGGDNGALRACGKRVCGAARAALGSPAGTANAGSAWEESQLAKDSPKGDAPVTIKKYANRRLYNTAKSSYVTLDHLAQMVRDGEDFVVYDAKTGEDITRSVLTQIIFEEEAKGQNMLPISFLRQLIRLYGDTLQGVVPGYLEASMEAFSRNQETLREQVTAAFGQNPALANFEAMAKRNMDFFQNAMRMFAPFAAPRGETPAQPSETPSGAGAETDIKALKEQLEAMQARLDEMARSDRDREE